MPIIIIVIIVVVDIATLHVVAITVDITRGWRDGSIIGMMPRGI